MLASIVETSLRGIDASILTDVFLFVLIAVFVLSFHYKRKHQHQLFTAYTPTLLTSLGILGTFAGIISGLLGFDTNDIDSSIGLLLGGLKTAFISSLAGMLLSIVYKGVVTVGWFIPKAEEAIDDDDVSNVDFYKLLTAQVDGIDQLRKAIAGDDDSSLVNVMKLQRAEANDYYRASDNHFKALDSSLIGLSETAKSQQEEFIRFQEHLWRQMQDFADMLSKSATEQVIEALKQVITDFNNNLIEQFGDNFKALNEAVVKLVDWQENYKTQLADMSDKYALGVKAISETEISVAHISEEAKAIPAAMTELKQVVEVNQHQINELGRHLEAFKDVRDKAVEAVPEIRSQIDQAIEGAQAANETLAKGMQDSANQMTKTLADGSDDFKNSVSQTNAALIESAQTTANSSEQIKSQFSDALKDINNHMRNLLDELQQGGKTLNDSFKQAGDGLLKDTQSWSTEFSSNLSIITKKLESTITEQANNHAHQADKVLSGLERTIESALANTGESVKKQVDMIDDVAKQEIEKVMNSMGSALSSIAHQFVNDYSRLVEQMNHVVKQRIKV
ncbi:MAG: hypothetical protein RPT25_09830 [Cycloclasticus sp.]|jgi:hypothetical protein